MRLVFGSFETTREVAETGDFIYSDPPYAPLSRTANFTSYTASRFDESDQARLQRMLVIDIARRGCHVLLSNSTAPGIAALYETNREAAPRACPRSVCPRGAPSTATRRGAAAIDEYLITNIPAGEGLA